MIIRKKP